MKLYQFGNAQAQCILLQPVGEQDRNGIEKEYREIKERTGREFSLLAIQVDDWNRDLSPWKAPAVSGLSDFGGAACRTLSEIQKLCEDRSKTYYLGGYSLAGLFALWAGTQTDLFAGIAAASPSVWFPGFVPYVQEQGICSKRIYLSLGDREEYTRNAVMSQVGVCLRQLDAYLIQQEITEKLEWNPGNHFRDVEHRMAKAFSWMLG